MNRDGLTLPELLCVLAIIGLAVLFAAPVFSGLKDKWELEAAARHLTSNLRLAQQTAVTTGKATRVEFREQRGDYRLFLPEEMTRVTLPEGVSYGGINFPLVGGVRLLYFHPTAAPSRGGTVILKNRRGDKLYVIVTPATGRVRVSKEPPDHW